MGNTNNIDLVQINPGIWTQWVKPYLFSFVWLFFVMLFAYLAIAVDYFFSEDSITFFKAYSKTQSNYLACIANGGFLFFAGVDYWQTHYHYQNYELQGVVLITFIISIIFTIILPFTIQYIDEHEGVLFSRGRDLSITWTCYSMHIIYLCTLLILRGETRKVRSIENYKNSYETNQYKK